jgi:hypothetical protein
VLRTLMFLLNMIDGQSKEEHVQRVFQPVKVKSLKVKEVELSDSLFAVVLTVFSLVMGYVIMVFVNNIQEAGRTLWSFVTGTSSEEEQMQRMIQHADIILRRDEVEQRAQEVDELWELISQGSRTEERDGTEAAKSIKEEKKQVPEEVRVEGKNLEKLKQKIEAYNGSVDDLPLPEDPDEREAKRWRTVVSVEIQGPVTGLGNGPFRPLSQSLQGTFHQIEEQKRKSPKKRQYRSIETQTDVTYKFWQKVPRYEDKGLS